MAGPMTLLLVSARGLEYPPASMNGKVPAHPLLLVGAHGSPYSRKMRALLRFRRVPFRWIIRGSAEDAGIPEVPVDLIPVLVFGPGDAMIDSTFQVRRLEREHAGRSVRPPDEAIAFLDALVEDFADEWLTKAMFHYRWAFADDARRASRLLPLERGLGIDDETLARFGGMFADRQIGRLGLVGSTPATAPLIEESYRRTLRALDRVVRRRRFLFGERPGAADFALYGQLVELVDVDPTSAAVAVDTAPRVVVWVRQLDDASGLEVVEDGSGWLDRDGVADGSLGDLLGEIGAGYAPFLLANDQALAAGAGEVECTVAGRPWTQRPFPYQRKCLAWLREAHDRLSMDDRRWVRRMLAGTGCEALFDGGKTR